MSATGLSAEDSTRFFGRAWGASSCGATVGWFGGKITRRAQERTRDKYDYRVMLNEDEGTHSMKLLIEEYDVDENAGVGAWVLLDLRTDCPACRARSTRRSAQVGKDFDT